MVQLEELPAFTMAQVAEHCSKGDTWIVVRDFVLDVSSFSRFHPGGNSVIQEHAGKDATDPFCLYHDEASILRKYFDKLVVGRVLDSAHADKTSRRESLAGMLLPKEAFGDLVPFGDPCWYSRLNSPYYKETHRRFRERVRLFVDNEVAPTVADWVHKDRPPQALLEKMGAQGLLACMVGQPFPAEYFDPSLCPKDFDPFHELILFDEIARLGNAMAISALTNGPSIGLTAVLKFGTEAQKRLVAPGVLSGREIIALAISEPNAGSDVAGLACSAVRQSDGGWIVNGNKKWITGGTFADWFVVAVVTDQRVADVRKGGMSFLLIRSDLPGFSVRKVNVRGSAASGTAYLDFDNCVVPGDALLGQEGAGFMQTMHNFNHERFYLAVSAARLSRVCLEESIKYALKRKTFGKFLHQHQAIRMKISHMARLIEQLQAWIELVAYQMKTMTHEEAQQKIGDVTALLKVQSSKVYELCARETTQIFGGNALYVGGPGNKIEVAVQQVKAYQIPGGAEDILDDFAARVAFKMASAVAKL